MDNHKRFREMFVKLLNKQGYIVYEDNYPSYLEDEIQKAVSYKRNKEYDKAIQIYLDIFESSKGFYPAILEYLYKAVICSGQLVFAYESILLAEIFAKLCWGMKSFLGDWSQTLKRKEFEHVIFEYYKQPRTFVSKENEEIPDKLINDIMANTKKVTEMLKSVASKYSGQSNFDFPKGALFNLDSMFDECGKIYNLFHYTYEKYLK